MSFAGTLFFLVMAVALLALPRRWAPLPLLAGACYMTYGQGIDIGPYSFTIIRMLVAVGVIRVLMRRERPAGKLTALDGLMLVWAAWALIASAFHNDPQATLTFHMGMTYNTLGIYFLMRCFCHTEEDVVALIKVTAIVLVPVALEMMSEQLTNRNLFAVFGGVSPEPAIRNGRLRSQGPFAHSILAGTVGAVCAPLMAGIWTKHPLVAKMGLCACLGMVVSSASSGPLMSLLLSGFALVLWKWRHLTRQMRIAAVVGYIGLDIVMKAPAYYLISRIDLTGSSTGYHRAALMEAAFKHLNTWWLAGTDYTRNWMPYGVPWSEDHADITNHYLAQGVKGGLPLMILFIVIVWFGFRYVGQILRLRSDAPLSHQFFIWTLGASLFAHATTCISVAYFDQSFLFLYLTLAVIVSMRMAARQTIEEPGPTRAEDEDYVDSEFDEPAGTGRMSDPV